MRKAEVGKNERRLELKRFEQSDPAFIGAPSLTFMLLFLVQQDFSTVPAQPHSYFILVSGGSLPSANNNTPSVLLL